VAAAGRWTGCWPAGARRCTRWRSHTAESYPAPRRPRSGGALFLRSSPSHLHGCSRTRNGLHAVLHPGRPGVRHCP
jgi:hypothetical protein